MDKKRLLELAGVDAKHLITEGFKTTPEQAKVVSDVVVHGLFLVAQTHIWHLQTRSYEEHKTLQFVYEGLDDKVDTLAENFQGGDVEIKVGEVPAFKDYNKEEMITILTAFADQVSAANKACEGVESVTFILEEIEGLISKSLYLFKLK